METISKLRLWLTEYSECFKPDEYPKLKDVCYKDGRYSTVKGLEKLEGVLLIRGIWVSIEDEEVLEQLAKMSVDEYKSFLLRVLPDLFHGSSGHRALEQNRQEFMLWKDTFAIYHDKRPFI